MAIDTCFYFQVHQPWRLRQYRFLEVGRNHQYFDEEKNEQILQRVAEKCYLPMNELLLELIQKHGSRFKAAFSISGSFIQQCEAYHPDLLISFKRLFDTGQVELMAETSHHSLASLYSPREFKAQVELHRELCTRHLIPPSKVFCNTELITSNEIARQVSEMGYQAICMEGADHVLRWRSPLFKYHLASAPGLVGLLKNYRLSDDIAFRFSDRGWASWPLTSEKFTDWVKQIEAENPVALRGAVPFLGLFMDYETFGEHQWSHSGIFDFMRALPDRLLKTGLVNFVTPTEASSPSADLPMRSAFMQERTEAFTIDAPKPFSWADVDRDLSTWQGNPIQESSLKAVYALEGPVRKAAQALGAQEGAELLETWRRLLSSDHFYYMSTKYFADGDVHKNLSPYESPYDAHILYMNVMEDMAGRCGSQVKAA
jgi:alpha-amylase